MANAFTLQGFESPEEVQARIGKAKEGAFAPQGNINQMIYQQAAQGAAGQLGAFGQAMGVEDPMVAKARKRQDILKMTDFTDPVSIKEAIDTAGEDVELKVKLAEMYKGLGGTPSKKGIKEIKVGQEIQTWQTIDGVPTKILARADRFSPDEMGLTGAGQSALSKAIGKKKGDQIVESQDLAKKANQGLKTATQAQNLLMNGIISGQFANLTIGAASVAKALGIDVGTDLENTQTFMAKMGNATLDILGSGALGAGTGISDNDRKFAKQIAGGEITLTEEAIKRIIDLNAKVNQNIIQAHNEDFETVRKQSPVDLSIKPAPWKSFSEYDKEAEDKVKKAKEGWSIKRVGE